MASVFTPRASDDYREQHLDCTVQPGVELGRWMEHRLGGPEWQGATGAEISVRALDVALTIGAIGPVGSVLAAATGQQAGQDQGNPPAPLPPPGKKAKRGATT